MIQSFTLYADAKQKLAELFGATEDLLHLHAGLIIFFASALLFRRRMRSRVPIALGEATTLIERRRCNAGLDRLSEEVSGVPGPHKPSSTKESRSS